MYKFVTKTFEGLKSFTQFLKIADIFLIMMLLLYWIQKLIGSSWEWTNFIKPLLDIFVEAGSIFSDKSVMLFSAVFEFKYFIALLLILFIYLLIHFCYMALCKLQELYEAGNDVVKRMREIMKKTLAIILFIIICMQAPLMSAAAANPAKAPVLKETTCLEKNGKISINFIFHKFRSAPRTFQNLKLIMLIFILSKVLCSRPCQNIEMLFSFIVFVWCMISSNPKTDGYFFISE